MLLKPVISNAAKIGRTARTVGPSFPISLIIVPDATFVGKDGEKIPVIIGSTAYRPLYATIFNGFYTQRLDTFISTSGFSFSFGFGVTNDGANVNYPIEYISRTNGAQSIAIIRTQGAITDFISLNNVINTSGLKISQITITFKPQAGGSAADLYDVFSGFGVIGGDIDRPTLDVFGFRSTVMPQFAPTIIKGRVFTITIPVEIYLDTINGLSFELLNSPEVWGFDDKAHILIDLICQKTS